MRLENPVSWRDGQLAAVPGEWQRRALKQHDKRGGVWSPEANLWLLEMAERMRGVRIPLTAGDDDLIALAIRCADECMSQGSIDSVFDMGAVRARMGRYVARYGIVAPSDTVTDAGAVKRMTDSIWWRRRLRVVQGREIEAEAIRLGYVSKRGEIYASDATVERRAHQKRRNAATMEGTEAVNLDTGEVVTLANVCALGVSSPRIRRGELMTRIAGFEAIAQGLEHVGVFITVTCPSRMHAKKTGEKGQVFDNPKYDGTTPREAQGYMVKLWAKVRAKLGRDEIAPYGFRIAEPHHDGAPHWHLLLFVAKELKAALCRIFAGYARAEDAHEMKSREARAARFLVKVIDPKKGSAAGYIAKYIAKNIDGYQLEADLFGTPAVIASQRVEAWAAQWGIRQFQQIGGAPVGVWRELRRMREVLTEGGPEIEGARAAADAANWRRYTEIQGGPGVKRGDLKLRVEYTGAGERYNPTQGEMFAAPPTRYGELAAPAVYGVREVLNDRVQVSRFFRWEIRRAGSGKKDAAAGGYKGISRGEHGEVRAIFRVENSVREYQEIRGGNTWNGCSGRASGAIGVPCSAGLGAWAETAGRWSMLARCAMPLSFDFRAGFSATWSPVNNCTRGSGDDMQRVQMEGRFGLVGAVLPAAYGRMQTGAGAESHGSAAFQYSVGGLAAGAG